MKNICKTKKN